MHKSFDHNLLSAILHSRKNWMMSYNDCPEIREMYKEYEIIKVDWQYSMSKTKECSEVLIFG
jgi:DNA adenine methylase